ncbi:hypothetical protein GCM10027285_07660 [Oleiagrimonas citrea]|uniref:Peptidase A1 domain-containing protein n=1 Tax=Oleiagrimonas citrea TaxID=1665687 RepID=A0A846ZK33_9GAMM|nr:avidin/streptavidin family protein [Oleiagrimonas citrea]NKZ38665.1 hypothetical protein [Oleiagrimonas citrea]
MTRHGMDAAHAFITALDAGVIARPDTPRVRFPLRRGAITDNGATPWTCTLGLGNPAQPLRFMLDTGTLNTWVTSSACTTHACRAHRAFDSAASSTFRASGDSPKSVDFGPWGTMQVELGYDICHLQRDVGGQVRTTPLDEPISFYLATDYNGVQFAMLDSDGGLAIPAVPSAQPSALLEQLTRQGLIDHAIATFDVDPLHGRGQCTMGAIDLHRFDPGSLNVLPVQPLEGDLAYLWNVPMQALRCGSGVVAEDSALVLDTGSSRFKGGAAVIARFQNAITDGGKRPLTVHDATALAAYPDIEVELNSTVYTLTPPQYFQRLGAHRWEAGVHVLEGLPDEMLVVGSVFLDWVYSIFWYQPSDAGPCIVALATPRRHTSSRVTGLWRNGFGSTLEIGPLDADGCFRGRYTSSTGASGDYPVVGVADPHPDGDSVAISFAVSWRSLEGKPDPSWHWVSGFTGLLQHKDGQDQIATTYLLQQNADAQTPDWMATAIYPSTFTRIG